MGLSTTTEEQADELLPAAPMLAEPAQVRVRLRGGRVLAWMTQPVNLLLLLCSLLPLVFVVGFVTDRGVDMPMMDDWENTAIIAVKTADGTLTLPDLFRQYVSHRMVFTNLYTAVTTVLAHWPIKFTLYFIIFQAVLCLLILAALFAKDQPRALPLVLLPFSALMFSVRQNINWLLSTQTSWFFMLLFFLTAALVLRFMRPSLRAVMIAGVLCVCGTYSTLHGLAAWPVLLLYMVMLGYRKRLHYGVFLAWALLGAGSFLLAFDYVAGTPGGMVEGLLREPYRLPLYLFTYLGNPFVIVDGALWPLAATIGVVGILMIAINAAFVYRRTGSIRPVATWLVVALWALGSGLLTSIGRAHYFPEPNPRHPLLDRYVLPASFLWFAFIALSVIALRWISQHPRGRSETVLGVVNVVVIVVLIGLFGWTTLWSYQEQAPFVTQTQLDCLQRFPNTRNVGCMTRGLYDTLTHDVFLSDLNGLAIHQLASFRDIDPAYVDIIPLHTLPRDSSREREGARFAFFEFEEGIIRPVFHQPAPSVSMFRVDVPQTDNPVIFFSAVHVELPDAPSGPPPDGVIFRVAVRVGDEGGRILAEIDYDPDSDEALKRVVLPLDAYRGQTIELYLQTDDRENPNADNAVWVDPGVLVLPAEED